MTSFADILDKAIEATAWKMTPPPAYGAFHLLFMFIGIALCFLIAYKLRGISERGHKAVLFSVGMFLIITEIYKQLFYYFYMSNPDGVNQYDWWIFPFQLCSVPMYLCLIAPLLKKGKVQSGMYNFMTTFNLLGGLMAFIEPSGIVHEYWTLTIHAFLWHMLLIFVGFYLIASGRFAKTKKDYLYAVVTFVCLCAIAFCINLIFWNAADGDINMFYVGPRNSPLVIFNDISAKFGWFVNTILYIPVVSFGAFLIYLPAHFYAKKKGLIENPS
jgi:uncharacterized membrane protein YwaF